MTETPTPTTARADAELPLGSPAKFCWTQHDVAAALQICIRQLDTVRKTDASFPKPRMLGSLPRWSPAAVAAWLASAATDHADSIGTDIGPQPGSAEKSVAAARRKPAKTAMQRRRTGAEGTTRTRTAAVAANVVPLGADRGTASTVDTALVAEVWHV